MPGDGPHPAEPADGSRPGRHDDPRLQAQRHHGSVRRDEPRHRPGPDPLPQGPHRQGRAGVLQADRRLRAQRSVGPRGAVQPLAHKAPEITKWLSHRDRRRWHLHFTPTSSSWVNLIERWFKELTDKRLRRGVFTNVPELIEAITTWGSHWNDDPKPFIWHATAADIIEKVQRGRTALNHQINSTTEH